MNSFNQPSFETRLIEKTSNSINAKSNDYFDYFKKWETYNGKITELDFQYRDYANASSGRKIGWCFLLLMILIIAGFDYASVAAFLNYLSISAGGVIGWVLNVISWLFFVFIELATGYLIIYYAKDKPFVKWLGILLAIVLIITPSYMIYTTYELTEPKTNQLLHKTIALIGISILLHTLMFLMISEVWAGIFYVIYLVKRKVLAMKDPQKQMKILKKSLQEEYTVFTRYAASIPTNEQAVLLTNLAWYIRKVITNSRNPYDLSAFDPDIDYAPQSPQQDSKTRKTIDKS